MKEAIFNEFGVCTNHEIIAIFGNDKVYYNVKAALYKGRVIASSGGHTPIQGFGNPLTKKDHDFMNIKEAISFFKKRAAIWAGKLPEKEQKIILSDVEESQLDLFD